MGNFMVCFTIPAVVEETERPLTVYSQYPVDVIRARN
jgi:hypothetical protein